VGFFFGDQKLSFQSSPVIFLVTWPNQSSTPTQPPPFNFHKEPVFPPAGHPHGDLYHQDCYYPQERAQTGKTATVPCLRYSDNSYPQVAADLAVMGSGV